MKTLKTLLLGICLMTASSLFADGLHPLYYSVKENRLEDIVLKRNICYSTFTLETF